MSGSPYITPEGRAALEAELASLRERRAGSVAALAAAAAEGDRSENAEYIYRKKELREIDRRLGYLQRRLPALKVVDKVCGRDRIYFGAWVTLKDDDGALKAWRLVGSDEFGRDPAFISIDAPLARGLLGKAAGEEVSIQVAGCRRHFVIADIRYE